MPPFHALQRTDNKGCARWVHFTDPVCTVTALQKEEVIPCLRKLEAYQQQGLHAVGWMAYEAAPAFDPHYKVWPHPTGRALLRFTVYQEQQEGLPSRESGSFDLSGLHPGMNENQFSNAVENIHQAIALGETYQVNLTYPVEGRFQGDPWSFFRRLRHAQAARHQAYIEEEDQVIISASPERFFKHQDSRIFCKPMKGTAGPGEQEILKGSAKNRSENIMIVDMIRNDLSKIADTGSVKAAPLFEIESFPSLVQMTSTVSATGSSSAVDWICALFPCASITGAPKHKTMEWIHTLEPGPRGIYTGCIGGFFGDGVSEFNVAIRTAVLEKSSEAFHYHSGCGIVWDSDPQEEYRESILKTRVLKHIPDSFELIETMRYEPGSGIRLWPFHRDRLLQSAAELGFELNRTELDQQIDELDFPKIGKVRLTLSEDGKRTLTFSELPKTKEPMSFRIDTLPTPSAHPELQHKTTRREIYKTARARHPEVDETLLVNERGELMEFCIGNVVWVKDGKFFTPPLSSGLLPGVARSEWLSKGKLQEKICTVQDIMEADEIYLINALRGWVRMQTEENTLPSRGLIT